MSSLVKGPLMTHHSLSRPWELREVDDGLLVKVTHRDLDAGMAMLLFDDLLELAQETGRPNLYLDFGAVESMSSAVLGRVILLHRKLRNAGGRLSLFSLNPPLKELLDMSLLTDVLDVRGIPLPRQPQLAAPNR
jgi:anti-anti-sigma factor